MRTSSRPADAASSTTYWIAGLSTTGSISLGVAFVAGRNLVPRPAAGMTALVILVCASVMRVTISGCYGRNLWVRFVGTYMRRIGEVCDPTMSPHTDEPA